MEISLKASMQSDILCLDMETKGPDETCSSCQDCKAPDDGSGSISDVEMHQEPSCLTKDRCLNCEIIGSYSDYAEHRQPQIANEATNLCTDSADVNDPTAIRFPVVGRETDGSDIDSPCDHTLNGNNNMIEQTIRNSCLDTSPPSPTIPEPSPKVQASSSLPTAEGPSAVRYRAKNVFSQGDSAPPYPSDGRCEAVGIDYASQDSNRGDGSSEESVAQLRASIYECANLKKSLDDTTLSDENSTEAECQQGAPRSGSNSSQLQPLNKCCDQQIQDSSAVVVRELEAINRKVSEILDQSDRVEQNFAAIKSALDVAIKAIEKISNGVIQVPDEVGIGSSFPRYLNTSMNEPDESLDQMDVSKAQSHPERDRGGICLERNAETHNLKATAESTERGVSSSEGGLVVWVGEVNPSTEMSNQARAGSLIHGSRSRRPPSRSTSTNHDPKAAIDTDTSGKSLKHGCQGLKLPGMKQKLARDHDNQMTSKKDTKEEPLSLDTSFLELGGKYPTASGSMRSRQARNGRVLSSGIHKRRLKNSNMSLSDQKPSRTVEKESTTEHHEVTRVLAEKIPSRQGLVINYPVFLRFWKNLSSTHLLESSKINKARTLLIGLYQRVTSEECIYRLGWWYVVVVVLIWHVHSLRYCLNLR